MLVDGRMLHEQQQEELGSDPRPNDLTSNCENLDQLIGYSHDQQLIPVPSPPMLPFHPLTHDT